METGTRRGRVKIGFEGSEELRRRVRFAALEEDLTVREYLTRIISEAVAGPEKAADEDDGCPASGFAEEETND